MVDVNKMQELDPALVNAQYGRKSEPGLEEKAAAIAFRQVTLLSAARTVVYFNIMLEAVRLTDASTETLEILEAVVKVCETSLTDPQARNIYDKAMQVVANGKDNSVNLMYTALAVTIKESRAEKLRRSMEEEKQTAMNFTPHDDHADMA